MPTPHTLTIDLSATPPAPSYDILIGDGLIRNAGELIKNRLGVRTAIIITDDHVAPLYAASLKDDLEESGHTVRTTLIMPAGEAYKTFSTLNTLMEQALAAGIDRQSLIIALGGGVVGDVAGLAAALIMRGVDVVQIPTTLLAQVDSSVGGKTAIDTPYGKNTVGSFHQPRLVLADVGLLRSLPPRERRAGYAEIIKYGLINDASFYTWCKNNAAALLAHDRSIAIDAVYRCCAAKAAIVAADEKEGGARALLNLGHTFGHALESRAGYDSQTLLHGEAVGIGMIMALRTSALMGLCSPDLADDLATHLAHHGLPDTPPPHLLNDIDALMDLMAGDKKSIGGSITLILTRGIGQAFVQKNAPPDIIRQAWADCLKTV